VTITAFLSLPAASGGIAGGPTGWWTDRNGNNHYGPPQRFDRFDHTTNNQPFKPKLSPTARAYNEGNRLYRSGRYEKAIAQYKRAIRLDPNNAQAWHNMGICYRRLERWQEARDAYRRVLSINPNHSYAQRALDTMDEYLEQLTKYKEQQAGIKVWESGLEAYRRKDYAQAIVAFRRCTEVFPDHMDSYLNLASAIDLTNDYAATRAAYERALEVFGPNENIRKSYAKSLELNCGMLYWSSNPIEVQLGEAFARRALELNFTNKNFKNVLLGNLLKQFNMSVEHGDLEWSEQAARKLIAAEPSHSAYYRLLGETLITAGDIRQGKAVFSEAMELASDDYGLHRSLGWALLNAGEGEGAVQAYRGALESMPDDDVVEKAAVHLLIFHCHKLNGNNRTEAIESIYQAQKAVYNHSLIHAMCAFHLQEHQRADEARRGYLWAFSLLPDDAFQASKPEPRPALWTIIDVKDYSLDNWQAKEMLIRDILPELVKAGHEFVSAGDYEAARQAYDIVGVLAPDNEAVISLNAAIERVAAGEVEQDAGVADEWTAREGQDDVLDASHWRLSMAEHRVRRTSDFFDLAESSLNNRITNGGNPESIAEAREYFEYVQETLEMQRRQVQTAQEEVEIAEHIHTVRGWQRGQDESAVRAGKWNKPSPVEQASMSKLQRIYAKKTVVPMPEIPGWIARAEAGRRALKQIDRYEETIMASAAAAEHDVLNIQLKRLRHKAEMMDHYDQIINARTGDRIESMRQLRQLEVRARDKMDKFSSEAFGTIENALGDFRAASTAVLTDPAFQGAADLLDINSKISDAKSILSDISASRRLIETGRIDFDARSRLIERSNNLATQIAEDFSTLKETNPELAKRIMGRTTFLIKAGHGLARTTNHAMDLLHLHQDTTFASDRLGDWAAESKKIKDIYKRQVDGYRAERGNLEKMLAQADRAD